MKVLSLVVIAVVVASLSLSGCEQQSIEKQTLAGVEKNLKAAGSKTN